VLVDDPGQQRIPDGPDGVVVPTTAPALLEQADEALVGQRREHQAYAVQIAVGFNVLPTEHVGLYDARH
jgi:hypothetical protein